MKAAIYTRISQDQTGARLGVDRQLADCMALADRLGWDVVAHFDDNDTSAYNPRKKRPGYESLLEAMQAESVQAVICWHTDRLYRRLGDLERLIDVADSNKVDIRTVQGGDLDLSTSAGRMVARILGSVSNAESEHKGERHRAANKQKAASGKWQTANRAFGYGARYRCRDNECGCDDYHQIGIPGEPLEPEASAFRKAVVDVMGGKSIQAVAREWNAAGLKTTLAGRSIANSRKKGERVTVDGTWNSPRVRRLLVNPRYAARKVHQGRDVGPGDWTPLIDVDTYNGLVAMLSDPSRVRCTSFERKYIGSGLYICGICQGTMKASRPGGRTTRAYVCRTHAHLLRTGEPLDDFVVATVLERLSRPDASALLANQGVDVTALGVKRNALQRKLDSITAMFDDDAIDAEQFAATSRSTRSKIAVIDQQLANVTRTSVAAALVAADDTWEVWQSMSPTQRAEAIDEVATVTVLPVPKGQGGRRSFDHNLVRVEFRRVDG